jgi:hypothetical protein
LERKSIDCLETLVERMIQVLELWRTLNNHPFHVLVAETDDNIQLFLRNASFLELVVDGQTALTTLIQILIHKYFKDDAAAVDAWHFYSLSA